MSKGATGFRNLLSQGGLLVLPGVYNALLARVMEELGFPCLYMSGFSVATSMLGRPDLGLLSLTEMVQQAKNIAGAIDVPLLADADTGYGGIFSVRRTVEEYEAAGLAGLHIEDQDLMVKRCGWLDDIQLVATDVMLRRLKAALKARRSEDFFIIARTDARRQLGFNAALERAKIYANEGADAVFVEYLTDLDEIRRVVDAVEIPVVVVVIDGDEMLTAKALESAGVRIALFPISVLNATIAVTERVGLTLKNTGSTASMLHEMGSPSQVLKYTQYEKMMEWESVVLERN
jgi:2,3-dimethylmalate lyase